MSKHISGTRSWSAFNSPVHERVRIEQCIHHAMDPEVIDICEPMHVLMDPEREFGGTYE